MSPRRARVAVALLVAASAVLRFAASRDVEPGWIAPDEAIYALLGRSLWEHGDPSVLGTGGYHAVLYPALIGLPLTVGDLATGVTIVQALQAVLASAAGAVAYLWGRRALGEGWAVVAAALALAVPGLAYTGLLMTEALLYLVAALALAALAAALERPTPARQALAALAFAAAVLTDLQALALLPAAAVAVALACGFSRSLAPARGLAPLLGVLGGGVLAVVGLAALRGSWTDPFGAYAAALRGYDASAAAADVVWHAGGLFVVVAGIPLLALALMVVECARRAETAPAATALVATAAAWSLCLVVEIGVFASQWADHVVERNLLPAAPPLFLVFGLWLARGLPRPRGWTQAAALLVAAPAVLLPVGQLAVPRTAVDAFGLVPLRLLAEATSVTTLELAFAGGAALLVGAAVLVPRRARLALPALVAVVLVGFSVVSSREVARLTQADAEWVFGTADAGWVDAAADAPVTYLHGGEFAAHAWKHLFWNRRIDAVAATAEAAPLPPLVPQAAALREDGLASRRLVPELVVAPSSLELAGRPVADAPTAVDGAGLTLWRVERPLRVLTAREGFDPNGDIAGGPAVVTVFGCGPGELRLTLLGKTGEEVVVTANEIPRRRVHVPAGGLWQGSIAAPPDADGSSLCNFRIASPGLVGSTVVEWVPASP